MATNEEILEGLRLRAKTSEKALKDLGKQLDVVFNKSDFESRIKKIELRADILFHGSMLLTCNVVDVISNIGMMVSALNETIIKITEQLPKITQNGKSAEKELSVIRQELDDQKKKIIETLQPLKQMIKQTEENQAKGNDIYG